MSKSNTGAKRDPADGPWNPDWWTPERRAARSVHWTPEMRAAMSAHRKAHPQGIRSKAWWTGERKAAALQRMAEGRAAAKARREAGG